MNKKNTDKILIVDDEKMLRRAYSILFERLGYEVEVAVDGLSALKLIQQNRYDLIILDIQMPGMNGIEVLKEILCIDRELPVILHSSYGHFREDFNSWIADAYVVKSNDFTELTDKVSELLNKDENINENEENQLFIQ